MYVGPYVIYPLFLSDFMKFWIFLTDFRKVLSYQILSNLSLVWAEFHAHIQTDRQTNKQIKEANTCFSQFYDTRLKTEPTRQKFWAVLHCFALPTFFLILHWYVSVKIFCLLEQVRGQQSSKGHVSLAACCYTSEHLKQPGIIHISAYVKLVFTLKSKA
jgi:hypothetical protein